MTYKSDKFLRAKNTAAKLDICRSSLYAKINRNSPYFDPDFPRPVALSSSGRGAVAWLESEVEAWMEKRAAARR